MAPERAMGEMMTSHTKETIEVARNASAVLNIPELLELVLCHVTDWPFFKLKNIRSIKNTDSLIDLYHCSLVCKFWKSIIDTSPSISRNLWKVDGKQSIAPINYHQSPFGCRVPTFTRDGELYPTINYPFISWLAWRVPRCFRDGSTYDIRDLHDQYTKDNFPPSYFSKPPATKILIHFAKLKFGIVTDKCESAPHISAIYINRIGHYEHPSQAFTIKNEQGVTVEDIIQAICALMDHRRGEFFDDTSPFHPSNTFSELKVGIFKRTEQECKNGVNRWSSLTRCGSFVTSELVEGLRTYEISNQFKLFAEMKRS